MKKLLFLSLLGLSTVQLFTADGAAAGGGVRLSEQEIAANVAREVDTLNSLLGGKAMSIEQLLNCALRIHLLEKGVSKRKFVLEDDVISSLKQKCKDQFDQLHFTILNVCKLLRDKVDLYKDAAFRQKQSVGEEVDSLYYLAKIVDQYEGENKVWVDGTIRYKHDTFTMSK